MRAFSRHDVTGWKGLRVCSADEQKSPNPNAALRNLRQPMPVGRKVRLVVRNTALRFVRLKSCCGHPGEPGC
jgi:hypothetical protein